MEHHLKAARSLADLMDNKFRIFGFRFGLDPILGFIPGGGDTVSLLISLYMVWIALKMNVPKDVIGKMVGNVITDFIIGLVPVLGDFGDFVFRANMRNYQLLEEHASPHIIEGEIIEDTKPA
jgi:hypothetical protein